MIEFVSETDFKLTQQSKISSWISDTIIEESFEEGEVMYIFCDDSFLLNLNQKYLDHDTLTDIISFDYAVGKQINGEIYISIERVKENAEIFCVPFNHELMRVIVHGILHYCGYADKTESEQELMRIKEDYYLANLTL